MNILCRPRSFALLLTATSAFLSLSAQAQEMPLRGPIPFSAYDTDSDGLISETEFNSVREQRLLLRAEKGRKMRGAATAPDFSEFDTDNDGQLSADELTVGQQKQMEKRRVMGMGKGLGKGNGQIMGMGYNMPTFTEYDLNGDGKLLEGEFNEARNIRITEKEEQGKLMRNLDNAPSFNDIDLDANGEISIDEFSKHQSQRRQKIAQ
ncbi:MAG: Ca2+-binding EF-hand superfamily protein [Psychromonas sp.]|jgi:Ca2+-binding EF-hand superfamily protein|uniref:EF-hand domain-containing protein n=1 Tax=Psychromonas sp. TaxID=1884585 RepID=UPI0039E4FB89